MNNRLIPKIENLDQKNAEFTVRPTRIAYLVNVEIDNETLLRVIEFNTLLWGGFYNLFVPVREGSIRLDWEYILQQYDPDIILCIGQISNELSKQVYESNLPKAIINWSDNLLSDLVEKHIYRLPVISIAPILENYAEKYHVLSQQDSNLLYPYTNSSLIRLILPFIAGKYTKDSPYLEFAVARLGCDKKEYKVNSLSDYFDMLNDMNGKLLPIGTTIKNTKSILHNEFSIFASTKAASIIITDGSIDDMFLLHAMKWVKKHYLIIPHSLLETENDLLTLKNYLSNFDSIVFMSHHVSFDKLREIREKAELGYRTPIIRCNWHLAIPAAISKPVIIPDVFHSRSTHFIYSIGKELRFNMPEIGFDVGSAFKGRWICDIDLSPSFGNRRGFRPSHFSTLTDLLVKTSFQYWGNTAPIRLAKGGISIEASQDRRIGNIFIPSHEELIVEALKDKGFKTSKSVNNSGQYASIMNMIGGLNRLKIFQNDDIVSLLIHKKLVYKRHAIEFKKMCGLVSSKSDEFKDIIHDLAQKRLFLRGYNLKCPACETTEWYSSRSIDEVVTCQGCLSQFQVKLDNLDFAYRLNSLLAGGNNQGTLTILLTLAFLHKVSWHSLIWQADIKLENSNKEDKLIAEIDLVCMSDSALVLVECKNRILPIFSNALSAEEKKDKRTQILGERVVQILKEFENERERKSIVARRIEQLEKEIRVAKAAGAHFFIFSTLDSRDKVPIEITRFLEKTDKSEKYLKVLLLAKEDLLRGNFEGRDEPLVQKAKSPSKGIMKNCLDKSSSKNPITIVT